MKLVMVFVDAAHAADVGRVLEAEPLPGYSEFTSVLGKGATGRKLGTRAFPGSSTLFVTVVPTKECRTLVDRLARTREARFPNEGLKVYAFDAEELL
jgi:hypothetical protein